MARIDNLKNFLTDVADSIRLKTGKTGTILASDFDTEITNIPSGGEEPEVRIGWTGSLLNEENLKTIGGWADEDIAKFKANGICWDAEDNEKYAPNENNIGRSGDNVLYYSKKEGDIVALSLTNVIAIPDDLYLTSTNSSSLFHNCRNLKYAPIITRYVSNFNSFYNTFYNCYRLEGTAEYSLPSIIDLYDAFYNCYNLHKVKLNIGQNSTGSGQNAFYNCCSLKKIEISSKISITNASQMFYQCYSLEEIPNNIDITTATNLSSCFYNCSALKKIPKNLTLNNATNVNSMLNGCKSLKEIDGLIIPNANGAFGNLSSSSLIKCNNLRLDNITSAQSIFASCTALKKVTNIYIPKSTSTYGMFSGCSSLEELDCSTFTLTETANANGMFQNCSVLKKISNLTFPKLENMGSAFNYCYGLKEIKSFHFGSEGVVTNAESMFYNCSYLINIEDLQIANISSARNMFYNCTSVKEFDLSKVYSTNLTNVQAMFSGCRSAEIIDIRNFDLAPATTYSNMLLNVPKTCKIIVKDSTQRDWINGKFSGYTNIVTVDEL